MSELSVRQLKCKPTAIAAVALTIITASALFLFQQELRSASTVHILTGLSLTTLISEDLATIAAGQLVAIGKLDSLSAILACMIGIIGGDLTLWLAGLLIGDRLLKSKWFRAKTGLELFQKIESGLDRHPGLLFTARFVPGMRLPIYLLAGATRFSFNRFAAIVFIGSMVWVPVIILLVSQFGETFTRRFEQFADIGIIAAALFTLAIMLAIRHFSQTLTVKSRTCSRWEFWPSWTLYVPVAIYMIFRHPIRVGIFGIFRITATNPGIPSSGIIGESKSAILRSMSSRHILIFQTIPPGDIQLRMQCLATFMETNRLDFPIILKPDQGQRGSGVSLIPSTCEASKYFYDHPETLIVQQYHVGPYEAGVFYYRYPGESHGHIFSITDKVFPRIIGDGKSTIHELIVAHPRLKMQFKMFAARHRDILDKVLRQGESFQLAIAGNHCQGTLFLDGGHLITPQLSQALDRIVDTFPGFYFGRFDLRYSDPIKFQSGIDFGIVELNGLTSESTNIYDPRYSYLQAIHILIKQWRVALSISEINVQTIRSNR